MDFSGFLSGLFGGFVADFAAGALVLYLGYRIVERRLRLEDRTERLREAEAHREQNLKAVLGSVHTELESNAAQLTTALRELPKGGIPYPLFELTMWPLVSDAHDLHESRTWDH